MARTKTAETPESRHPDIVHRYVAEALDLLARVESDLENAYDDVEGHLRVVVTHLRHIVSHIEPAVAAEPDPEPEPEVAAEPEPEPETELDLPGGHTTEAA